MNAELSGEVICKVIEDSIQVVLDSIGDIVDQGRNWIVRGARACVEKVMAQ